jgi:hypothetical protein
VAGAVFPEPRFDRASWSHLSTERPAPLPRERTALGREGGTPPGPPQPLRHQRQQQGETVEPDRQPARIRLQAGSARTRLRLRAAAARQTGPAEGSPAAQSVDAATGAARARESAVLEESTDSAGTGSGRQPVRAERAHGSWDQPATADATVDATASSQRKEVHREEVSMAERSREAQAAGAGEAAATTPPSPALRAAVDEAPAVWTHSEPAHTPQPATNVAAALSLAAVPSGAAAEPASAALAAAEALGDPRRVAVLAAAAARRRLMSQAADPDLVRQEACTSAHLHSYVEGTVGWGGLGVGVRDSETWHHACGIGWPAWTYGASCVRGLATLCPSRLLTWQPTTRTMAITWPPQIASWLTQAHAKVKRRCLLWLPPRPVAGLDCLAPRSAHVRCTRCVALLRSCALAALGIGLDSGLGQGLPLAPDLPDSPQDVVLLTLPGPPGAQPHVVLATAVSPRHAFACAEAVRFQARAATFLALINMIDEGGLVLRTALRPCVRPLA